MLLDDLVHNLVTDLNSHQRDLLCIQLQNDWLVEYLGESKSIRAIHRWNFLQPFTDLVFQIEPLHSIFNRYLNYLHYCRFHNPEPIVHLDSDLLWILWYCQKNSEQFPKLSRSSLQLFCQLPEANVRLKFFEDNNDKLEIDGAIFNLLLDKSLGNDITVLSNQAHNFKIPLNRDLQIYREGLREKLKNNLDFVPALIPYNEEINVIRSLYDLQTVFDRKFDGRTVSKFLHLDWNNLSPNKKIILELTFFEEWNFIKRALTFPSTRVGEDPTIPIRVFNRSIPRNYFCWIENSTHDKSESIQKSEHKNPTPGIHLHNASCYIEIESKGNMLNGFMQRFRSNGTGKFLDSVLPELLNQLDQSVEKWTSETADYEKPWNYFLRIASILWRKSLVAPMTVHLDLTSRCNTKCSFCGYHSPLIKERVWAHSGWQTLDLDFQIYKNLQHDLTKSGGADEVLLIGGGEPILHKYASTIVRGLSSATMNPYLFTNGLVVNEDQSIKLIQAGLSKFYWSIHAADDETWVSLHPGATKGQFERVKQNLKRFIQIRNENQADTKVIVIHALCKQNYTQIEKMVIQSRDLGVDELRFQLMQPVCSELHEQLPNHSELVWIKQTIENLLENKTQGKMVVEANINWQLERKDERLVRDSPEIKSGVWKRSAKPTTLPVALDLEKRLNNPTNTILKNSRGSLIRKRCYAGYFVLRNFVDGRLSYCFHDRIVGDLKENSFSDIWHSKAYQNLRDKALSMDATENISLWDGHKGNWLVAEDCASCSNYEMQTRVEHTLRKTGWWIYLHPESM